MNHRLLIKLTLVSLLTLGLYACGGGDSKSDTNAKDTVANNESTSTQDTVDPIVDTANAVTDTVVPNVDTTEQEGDTLTNENTEGNDLASQLLGTWKDDPSVFSFTFSEGNKMRQITVGSEAVGTYSLQGDILTVRGKYISHVTNDKLNEQYKIVEIKDKKTLKLMNLLPSKHTWVLTYRGKGK